MNERRMMLIDSKDVLSSWGTWKTASELQDGDIIYGVAISFVSEIEYNDRNGSSSTRYSMRLYYNKNTTDNLYSTLIVGKCLISAYEPELSVMIEPYGGTYKDYILMNDGFTFYASDYRSALCAAQAYWYDGNNRRFTDGLLPNGGAGMYVPFYFSTMSVYRNNSQECIGARFKYVAADANSTFPQNYDEVLFLTSDIISQ